MYEELVIVALGGNAMKQSDEKGTTDSDFRFIRVRRTYE
jgi:carbamate kinase